MRKCMVKLGAFAAILCLLAMGVSAKSTDCQACGKAAQWEEVPASAPTAAGHYHYYLTGDVTFNQWEIADGVTLCLDLRGNTVNAGARGRVFAVKAGVLNIMDSVGGGEIVGKSGSGNAAGGVMIMYSGSTCNMYGGTMRLVTKYVAGLGVGTGGIVYMNEAGTFNLYGGTIQGAELVISEYALSKNGCGAAMYLSSASQLNVYGGHIRGGSVPETGLGECVYINSAKTKVTLSGNGCVDEVFFSSDNDQLTVEGTYTGTTNLQYKSTISVIQGSVLGICENASIARATLKCGDWMLTDEGGKLIAIPDSAAAVLGGTVTYHKDVQTALETGGSIRLLKNGQTFTVTKDVLLDLNGLDATATVEAGTLTVQDSQTDDYTVEDGVYGSLTATGKVTAKDGYLQAAENGKLSFHKADLQIYAMTLRPETAGVYYRSRILGDRFVTENIEKFGVALNVFEAPCAANMNTTGKYSEFTRGDEATGTLLYGIVKRDNPAAVNEENANMPIYGSAYLVAKDGTCLFGNVAERTLRQQVEAVDAIWHTLAQEQKTAAAAMYGNYTAVMESWDVPNIRAEWMLNDMKIEIEKDCGLTPGNTVAPGQEITCYLNVTNNGSETQTISLRETVPENTTCEETTTWSLTLAAGETRKLSYTLRVKDDLSLCDGGSIFLNDMQLFVEHTLNKVDGGYFVDAVKAMSDSTYTGMDLANRLFIHAFSQSVLNNNSITATALEDILAGENAALLDMVAPTLFGGKTMPTEITDVKGKSAGTVTEKDLINGDILLADGKVYAYAQGLWLLEKGATKQDTRAVLAALPESDKYAVLRPTCALAGIITPTDLNAPVDEMNDYQKALVATAEAYLLRGEKLQYSDTRFTTQGSSMGTEFRWLSKVNAPEDCTSVEWGYTNCAAFTFETYYQGLGFTLPDNMYTTKNLVNNGATNGTRIYHYHRDLDSVQTDEEKAQVEKEFTELLQPGDILVILREGGYGHAMLYVGNGNIIHSSGSVYQYTASVGTEVYEASIRRMKVKDYFFNPASARGYVFDLVQDLAIIRPLQIFNGEIPQNTVSRLENMQGIMAQKTSSHAKSQTVNPGDEMTFTYEIYNTNPAAVTLDVMENLPANTTYISGGETVDGNQLSWKLTIPADTRVKVSYKLKVNADAPYGSSIQSTDSTVGGVTVKCPAVQVKRTLTATEQAKLIQAVKDMRTSGNSLTGLTLVNKLYETATGTANVFASTDVATVCEGADGIFAKKQMSTESTKRQIFKMNTGSKYNAMVAPTLYGGYRMWTPMWQHDRTRLPQEHDLQVGDVLIGRTLSSRPIFMYLGEELGFVNMTKTTLDADTTTVDLRLERLHGYGYYFAILRPSMAMDN